MAVEYIVNSEKRTVVAILKGTELDAHKAIVRQVGEADESFFGFNSKMCIRDRIYQDFVRYSTSNYKNKLI